MLALNVSAQAIKRPFSDRPFKQRRAGNPALRWRLARAAHPNHASDLNSRIDNIKPRRNLGSVIELAPKKRFQENEEAVRQFRIIVDSKTFQAALSDAVAEYAVTTSPTTEQLNGVRSFISLLLNFAENEVPLPQFPQKRVSIVENTRADQTRQPTK